jgi:hypothetical protein
MTERFTIELSDAKPSHAIPAAVRIRRLVKLAGRAFSLKVVSIIEMNNSAHILDGASETKASQIGAENSPRGSNAGERSEDAMTRSTSAKTARQKWADAGSEQNVEIQRHQLPTDRQRRFE